ncbi:zf-HC2 domain-containing protein [Nitrosomonas oligotropha]|uniref:zf-HC2 domain-containing protein n=1 Tax=Nitrosomonas oligotropha TaxID=42354 RepID=UPI00136925FD|nr:zf-HC2 domain-containing protein [Nitrosomonas oligotropha]MXS81938.1 zf-HC2 domain-containing protein [Nitrosomonas oligotropha]
MSSTMINVTGKNEHQKVWNLLPWYVNHSLDAVEKDRVRNHIRTCIACRIELQQQQQLFEEMQQTDLLRQVSQAAFAQLRKRIERQSVIRPVTRPNQPGEESKPSSGQSPTFVKHIALAASLLLLAMPFMLHLPVNEPALTAEYRTLASAPENTPAHNLVRIVFADQPDLKQIGAILHSVSGHIVQGPSENGIYEIQIGDRHTRPQEIDAAIAHLRNNNQIIFAERVQGLQPAGQDIR